MTSTLAGAQLLGVIANSNLLQHIEQIKRLVWLIDTGAARLSVGRDESDRTTITVTFPDGGSVVGCGLDCLIAFRNMLERARHEEGPLA